MDRFTRILSLHKILASRRAPISRRELEERLESNRSTVKRAIEEMRDYLGAPIVYDPAARGYRYERREGDGAWDIPGLWFNAEELLALTAMRQLLSDIQPGLLDDSIKAFNRRIESLLEGMGADGREVARRVKIFQMQARAPDPERFRKLTTALLRRCRIRAAYRGRGRGREQGGELGQELDLGRERERGRERGREWERGRRREWEREQGQGQERGAGRAHPVAAERTLSPQRLVYYRDNWYLDAWCHMREALRTFSVDRLAPLRIESAAALEFSDEQLDAHFTRTFGIFSGPAAATAELRFTPEAAKWAADERWHPEQTGRFLPDGSYRLQIPYGNPTELVREVLKYGPGVEVAAPESLRIQVREALRAASALYPPPEK